jgi:hypothetical protein
MAGVLCGCSRRQTIQWRSDDIIRQFVVGDVLRLREWDPAVKRYTGRECFRRVTYTLRNAFGIPAGFVVMGLKEV